MKHMVLIIMISALLLGSVGCMKADENQATESAVQHGLTITAGNDVIDSKRISADESDDNDVLFKFAFENSDASGIKYIKTGEKIVLDFGKDGPDSVSAEDIFLDQSGKQLYTDKETEAVALTSQGQKFEFILEQSIVLLLSSEDPEGRLDIRGFKLTARWGNNVDTYAFVIKTDSGYSPS